MTQMPERRTALVEQLRGQLVCTVPVAAGVLGRSVNRCYEDIRRTGKLAGIEPIRLSEKSIRIPTRKLLALVGEDVEAGA
jgi:hypothetical protein